MIYSVDVRVTAPVRDTEVPDRVVEAVETLFPGADASREDDSVVATVHDLDHLSQRLHAQRILDTARGVFFDRRGRDGFSFDLKKQAARHDVVNFAVGDPGELGVIHVDVTVHDPDVESYIDHVAPETDAEGRPVDAADSDDDAA